MLATEHSPSNLEAFKAGARGRRWDKSQAAYRPQLELRLSFPERHATSAIGRDRGASLCTSERSTHMYSWPGMRSAVATLSANSFNSRRHPQGRRAACARCTSARIANPTVIVQEATHHQGSSSSCSNSSGNVGTSVGAHCGCPRGYAKSRDACGGVHSGFPKSPRFSRRCRQCPSKAMSFSSECWPRPLTGRGQNGERPMVQHCDTGGDAEAGCGKENSVTPK